MSALKPMIAELGSGNVYIADPENVNSIIKDMIQAGKDSLQVVADFDMTLSKYMHNGCRCDTSHGVIDESPYLDESFKQRARANRIYYQGIEFDPTVTQEKKLPLMVEWWKTEHDLLVSQNIITKDMVRLMAVHSNCILREGYDEMFEVLHRHDVPVLIFSAGIGDLIEAVISAQHVLTSNVKVVSNFMCFDDKGLLRGFQDTLIHCLNKNELVLADTEYFDKLQSRQNILLMGDSLGDLHMADGARHTRNMLKIGFLNRNVTDNLEVYMRAFDIVVVEDDTLRVTNAIISRILQC